MKLKKKKKFELLFGNCLTRMEEINSNTVDFCLSDIPYMDMGTSWEREKFLKIMWKNLSRIVKNNGVIAIFGTEPFSSYLRISNIDMYKYDFKWIKSRSLGANFLHAKNSPLKISEDILIFSRGQIGHEGKAENRMIYYPQGLKECEEKEKKIKLRKIDSYRQHLCRPSHKNYIRNMTNYPDNICRHNFDKQENQNRFHPIQKPISLLEYLIQTYSLKNDTILDPFMGAGSVGIACKRLDRNFIGIENNIEYFKKVKKRLEKS